MLHQVLRSIYNVFHSASNLDCQVLLDTPVHPIGQKVDPSAHLELLSSLGKAFANISNHRTFLILQSSTSFIRAGENTAPCKSLLNITLASNFMVSKVIFKHDLIQLLEIARNVNFKAVSASSKLDKMQHVKDQHYCITARNLNML